MTCGRPIIAPSSHLISSLLFPRFSCSTLSPLPDLLPPQVGAILGKGGAHIKTLRDSTGAGVKLTGAKDLHSRLPAAARPGDELLALSGPPEAVYAALLAVSSLLRQAPPKEAGLGRPRQQGNQGGGHGGGAGVLPGMMGMMGMAFGGGGGYPHHSQHSQHQQQHLVFPAQVYNGGGGVARRGGGGGRGGNGGGGGGGGSPLDDMAVTVTVEVPAAHVGSIIGVGGANINQVRNVSGAKVKLHESKGGATPEGQNRLVEICGTPEQARSRERQPPLCVLGRRRSQSQSHCRRRRRCRCSLISRRHLAPPSPHSSTPCLVSAPLLFSRPRSPSP